jgi:TetR/AcrR family transcriptional regulator of autoinduction and epiphytic fitness
MVKGSDVPEAILIAAVQQTLEIIMTPVAVGLLRLVITENLRAPELGRVYLERGKKRVLGQIIEIIQALSGKNALEVEDSRAAAEQLMGMVKEAIYWPILTGLPIPAPRERNRVIRDAVITFYARYGER